MADQTGCCDSNSTLELIGLTFSGFVILLVAFVYVRYLLLWQLPPPGPAHDRRPKAGLDPSAIAALPSFAYPRGGEAKCTVCLGEVAGGETVRLLPACGHMFHAECIDLWLLSKSTCPVCRAEAEPGKNAEKVELEERRVTCSVDARGDGGRNVGPEGGAAGVVAVASRDDVVRKKGTSQDGIQDLESNL